MSQGLTHPNISGGTINSDTITNGSIVVTNGTIGSLPNIPGGTLGSIIGIGSVSGLSNLPGGSIVVTTGTINTGTISSLPNIPGGSIVVTNGTVIGNGGSMIAYGPAAAAAAAAGNPLNMGGTDSGGTIRTIKVDSGGLQRIGIDSGTISILPNLPQGSINVTAGTIATLGTMGTLGLVNTVTTVSNLTNGSINVTAGTIATLGTMGTLGTITGLGTLPGVGVVSNLSNGSIVITNGTINTGTINAGTINVGTINAGTINVGTITGGTLQNLTFGTIAISDGTTKANVMAAGISNGTGAQNAQLMAGGFAELSGSATAGTTDIIPSIDVSAYRYYSLQITNTFVGTIGIDASNDNSNFRTSIPNVNIFSPNGALQTNITGTTICHGIINTRYMRVRMNAFTSGTAQGILELFTVPPTLPAYTNSVAQSGAWNIGTMGTLGLGTVQLSYPSFSYISAAGTTNQSTTAGILHAVILGSVAGAGTVYNSNGTSNAIIWSHASNAATGQYHFDVAYGSLTYACATSNQVTVVYK